MSISFLVTLWLSLHRTSNCPFFPWLSLDKLSLYFLHYHFKVIEDNEEGRKTRLTPSGHTIHSCFLILIGLYNGAQQLLMTYLDPIEVASVVSCSIYLSPIPILTFSLSFLLCPNNETKDIDSRCVRAYIPLLQCNSELNRSFSLSDG